MGLWFPTAKLIQKVCKYFGLSTSQLLPNSFSILLSLGILFKFFGLSRSTSNMLRFVGIKRVGPWRFFIIPQPEHNFLGGNPSSHKGWLNRYFFVKAPNNEPWFCNMTWVDEITSKPSFNFDPEPLLKDFVCSLHVIQVISH